MWVVAVQIVLLVVGVVVASKSIPLSRAAKAASKSRRFGEAVALYGRASAQSRKAQPYLLTAVALGVVKLVF